eukprot:31252-Pelagococcus_subviridis.AAC.13
MRRAKSLRNGVHHADADVWGPVYRTHLVVVRVEIDALQRVVPRDVAPQRPQNDHRDHRGQEQHHHRAVDH